MTVTQVFFSLEKNGQCQALTFCDSMVTLDDAICLNMFYYGKDDARQLASHICTFWRHSFKSVKQFKRCFLVVGVPKSVNVDAVADALTCLCGTRPPCIDRELRFIVAETKERLHPEVT